VLLKVEGAGNDFVLGTGAWAERLATDRLLAARLCARRRGVGADGTLALRRLGAGRVRLDYRNADGSLAEFCANGTRCAARAAVELLDCRPDLVVETGWVEVPTTVSGSSVTLRLPPVAAPTDFGVSVPGVDAAQHVVVGVPHLVLTVEDTRDWPLETIAPPVRRDRRLGPDGANVHLAAFGIDRVNVRSFERGVEAETLCCGSGVVAAGLVALSRTGGRRVKVVPRSGDALEVAVDGEAFGGEVWLTGPTRVVAFVEPAEELLEDDGPATREP
jgi:diaminopimelate epimerase